MAREHWHLTQLGDLISIKHGWPFRSQHMAEYLPGRPIVVGIGNFEYSGGFRFESTTVKAYTGDYPKEFILKPGDVLLVMTCQTAGGEILGIPGRIPNDGRIYLHNQRMGKVIIKDRKKVEMGFLYWLFLTSGLHRHLVATATGTKILHTAPERIESFSFLLPPPPIQRTIANILSAYDNLIENNTRRIAILEEMAQMLYQEWFVKFRFPGHEKNRMVESELGMIPEGWELLKLGDVIELAYGKALKADARFPGNVPVYGSAGIVGYHQEKLVNGPGIIVGRKGNVGSVFWANSDFYPIDTVFYIHAKLPLYYVYYNLCQQHFINNDAAVPGLSRHQAYSLPFIRPSDIPLRRFEDFVKPVFLLKANLLQRNSALRRARDLLLPKLISGEIDVSSWVERDVEEAARELAVSVGTTSVHYPRDSMIRRVAEVGPVAPIEEDALEWQSLWE